MEYVAQVTLTINGEEITDFKKIAVKEIEVRKPVKLMKKRGFVKVTPEHGFDVDYVIPKDSPEFDFEDVENATLTIDYENGARKSYAEVCTGKVGGEEFDDENEAVRKIELFAGKRIKE